MVVLISNRCFMKVIQVHLGLLPIPPNGWGAVEKIIWDYYTELNKKGLECEIKYLDDIKYNENTIIHVHVANLANVCHSRGIPYIFTLHDHHAYLYGKDSSVFKDNLKAIENSIISTCPAKYLVNYFDNKKLRYFSHAVNTDTFICKDFKKPLNKLLCVANNGYCNDQSYDRKGFTFAIKAAKELNYPITIAGPSNNKKFFETLDPELNNYKNLTKLFDLNEEQLIELYNKHSIFIHASELEAGHPNLTLLEAMSCGLPVVGTFETSQYDGMIVVERNVEQIKSAINKIIDNYQEYKITALLSSKLNSYEHRVNSLIDLYDEYTEKLFGNKFLKVYDSLNMNFVEQKVNTKIKYNFNDVAFVEIDNPIDKNQEFEVKFNDSNTNKNIYTTILKHSWWGKCDPNYYIPYNITVEDKKNNIKLIDYTLDLKNKNVLIDIESQSIGDQLAWMPLVEQFRKKHECNIHVRIHLKELFQKKYPNINFLDYDNFTGDFFATYKLGWFVDNKTGWNDRRHKSDPRKMNLQKVGSDILGLDYLPELPLLDFKIKKRPIPKKYVAIATQSTSQSKYWNYKNGWVNVITYLKSLGYDVICIDKHKNFGNSDSGYSNTIPENCIDMTGDLPLTERINQLYHCDFFIGLPSGLSWLSWAVKKPTILISGFSYPYTEFTTPYRVQNLEVCSGCWNDNYFDRGNWSWCPKPNKKEIFECTKSITPKMVITTIDKLIKDNNL